VIFIASIIMAVRCFEKSQMASCFDPKRSYTEVGPGMRYSNRMHRDSRAGSSAGCGGIEWDQKGGSV